MRDRMREPPATTDRLPTLTEVVEWPDRGRPADSGRHLTLEPDPDAADPAAPEPVARTETSADRSGSPSAEELTERVLAEVQHQIDRVLEQRLHEVLAPLLNRVADDLVREAGNELASTLREVVAGVVAQTLARD